MFVIALNSAFTDSQLTVTLPATGLASHYIIRVCNGNESAEIRSLAEEAYKSFVWQGFNPANTLGNASEKTLYYLAPDAFIDINKDGFNDRDGDTTTAALSAAVNI